MNGHLDDNELEAVVSRLKAERAQMTPLEMDALKRRVMRRPTTSHKGAHSVKARLTTLLTVLSLAGGTGGAIAVAANGDHRDGRSSADAQYRGNGKKCGQPGADPSCPKHYGPYARDFGHHHTSSQAATVSELQSNIAFDRKALDSLEDARHPDAASVKQTLALVNQDIAAAKALHDSADAATLAALARELTSLSKGH